ncbi:MAG: hypothetical protein WDO14_06260 [Bacteroidota bacterium]
MKTLKIFSALALMLLMSCNNDPESLPVFAGMIETFAGSSFGCDGDGQPALGAKFGYLTSIAIDANGNIYVSDAAANVVRKINTANTVSTIAGKFIGFNVIDPTPYHGDGGMAYASHLNVPLAVAVDPPGNVYISDTGNNVIRKVNANGEIETIIGNGAQGSSGDNGPASEALIYSPNGIAFDISGNMFFTDTQNHTIRKVSTTGEITTIAGTPGEAGYSGDEGNASSAKLNTPTGITVAKDGTIYFCDNNSVVRRIPISGIITTIAGNGQQGYSGDGGKATDAMLLAPKSIAIGNDGSILIADSGNNRIRRVSPETQFIDTIAGTGVAGHTGDFGYAISATLSNPQGIVVAGNGYIYVAESGSSVVRLIKPAN